MHVSRHKVYPESIRNVIDGYTEARPRLLRASPDYPEPAKLLAVVSQGLPYFGMSAVGQGYDSGGSELLIGKVDHEDPHARPLHIAVWGGANVLAQVSECLGNEC